MVLTVLIPNVICVFINAAQQSGELVDGEDTQVFDGQDVVETLNKCVELMLHAIDEEHLGHSFNVLFKVGKCHQLI